MRCFTHPLLRKLLGLSPRCMPGGFSQRKATIFSPKWSSLRQSCSARPELVTAMDVVNYWQKVFETNRIPEARESSEYIVSFVLGAKTFQSLNSKSLRTPLTAVQQEQIQQLSYKRLERVPVQYVLGEWDFQDLTLKMRPPVFIPRPETEKNKMRIQEQPGTVCLDDVGVCFEVSCPHTTVDLPVRKESQSSSKDYVIFGGCEENSLVSAVPVMTLQTGTRRTWLKDLVSLVVEEEYRKREKNSGLCFPVPVPHPVILEIGCGSGAIALSLLCRLPQSQVIAMDKQEAAVDLTRENAHRLHLQERIHIFHHDILYSSARQLLLWGPVDIIVSNPPYVFHEDMASLDAEILRYEDLDALDGGDDGMSIIKTILSLAPSLLKDSGSVFLEVEPRHPVMVESWLQAHPNLHLVLRAIHKDFCGKPRFLHMQKQSR